MVLDNNELQEIVKPYEILVDNNYIRWKLYNFIIQYLKLENRKKKEGGWSCNKLKPLYLTKCGCDRKVPVVGFTTTYASSAYHH